MTRCIILCFLLFSVLAATLAQSSQGHNEAQGGPHQNQGRIRRQAQPETVGLPQWTTCDMATTPKISCQDCNTRLICKPIGGLLRKCNDPSRPFCNNGICSAIPSAGCA